MSRWINGVRKPSAASGVIEAAKKEPKRQQTRDQILSCHRSFLKTIAGTPSIVTLGGTSFSTTEFAPILALSPILTLPENLGSSIDLDVVANSRQATFNLADRNLLINSTILTDRVS